MKLKKTYIIAEAGVNHNGSLEIAEKLIKEAKRAGADAIKFQSFKASSLVSQKAKKADYQKKNTLSDESQYEMLRKLELSRNDHEVLLRISEKYKMKFLSSPFDEESVDILDELGIEYFKIPSGEITNHPFLRHVAAKKKPIILSTGMSNLGEIEDAINVIYSVGNKDVSLLHCVTEYPAPFNEINLKAMHTMEVAFKLPVGYSDHSVGYEISLAAVALGAKIIEKHFTLDRNMPGPDHKASLVPGEFKEMVNLIRNVEVAIGDGIKKPARCELKNIPIARKSIVAINAIKKGEKFSYQNIGIKRPGGGLHPKYIEELIGKESLEEYLIDDIIKI